MSRFYSRTGDDGFTAQLGEGRIPKYHPRTEAVGVIDEATAAIGMARASCQAEGTGPRLLKVQRDLYNLMAEVSAPLENAPRFRTINALQVTWLEEQTDSLSGTIQMPKEFIVPGDTASGAALSLARAIVRRAERRISELLHSGEIENVELLRYLNRLSSLLFVMELVENQVAGKGTPTLAKG